MHSIHFLFLLHIHQYTTARRHWDALAPNMSVLRPFPADRFAGATGLVGSRLVAKLTSQGHKVKVLTRNVSAARSKMAPYAGVECFAPSQWAAAIAGCTGVVNLAGEPIGTRWTPEIKAEIKRSRLTATNAVVVRGIAFALRGVELGWAACRLELPCACFMNLTSQRVLYNCPSDGVTQLPAVAVNAGCHCGLPRRPAAFRPCIRLSRWLLRQQLFRLLQRGQRCGQ